jgi:glycosyltransferase involved in cell wall biosynthesis
LTEADLFVLSSDYEGLGNVLVEALFCGLPIVSTDCPHGPREVLMNGKYGALVRPGDAAALADAIVNELSKEKKPEIQQMGAEIFLPDKIASQYLSCLGFT